MDDVGDVGDAGTAGDALWAAAEADGDACKSCEFEVAVTWGVGFGDAEARILGQNVSDHCWISA